MLYISDIFNVDTKEHYDRIKSFTQAQMMYCVELRDFTTGEQRAMCMPKVVVAEEIIPFGVVALKLRVILLLCTIGDYGYYFTMFRDAVRLHEKGIITYRTTRASSSKPNLSIVALSENNILAEEELSRFNRVSTNIYDIILSNKGVVSQDGSLILNSLYSTLEIVFDVGDYDYLNNSMESSLL